MKRLVLVFLLLSSHVFATTFNSDGTPANIQAIHDSAGTRDGDTITIPSSPGTPFAWASRVSLTKAVKLQGAGSGRIIAWSHGSDVTFGTGSKQLDVQSGFSIANNTTVRIWNTGTDKETAYMLGTVTSLAGVTLTVNVTTNTGSGTKALWLVGTEYSTAIVHNSGTDSLITVTESSVGSTEISGIQFMGGTGTGPIIEPTYTTGGQPILVHDCFFYPKLHTVAVENSTTNRGVWWNCSVCWPAFGDSDSSFMHLPVNARTESWSTPSTMGMADTNGKNNIYVEDCDFHAGQGMVDIDSNARIVWRHNEMDHGQINSHGYDTSAYGNRHWEFYNNNFLFVSVGAQTLNCVAHILLRGGTGVITDNYFQDINSGQWGPKKEIIFGVWCLGRWGQSPGAYSADDGGVVEYPAPRQFGFGYVTGAGVDGQGNSTSNSVYVGDLEPAYVYNNTGFTPEIEINTDGAAGVLNGYGHVPDAPGDYIQAGRDYFNDGTPKPGYVKYTYPHPLRGAAPAGLGTTSVSGSGHSTNSGSGATTIAQ